MVASSLGSRMIGARLRHAILKRGGAGGGINAAARPLVCGIGADSDMGKRLMSSSAASGSAIQATIELTSFLEKRLSETAGKKASGAEYNEVGKVIGVGDGIARVYGLNNVQVRRRGRIGEGARAHVLGSLLGRGVRGARVPV